MWKLYAWCLIACLGCGSYEDGLDQLITVDRLHNGEAMGIVADTYGIDVRKPEVRWVVQNGPIYGTLDGVTVECASWVWWNPAYGNDPRASTLFWTTSMAHEMAHCARRLYTGDGDGGHTDQAWWGRPGEGLVGGLVGVAMAALRDRGL